MTARLGVLRELDWLGLFLLSFVAPIAYDAWRPLTYATSLLFWLVPTLLLWPRFSALTDQGGRRRTAFVVSVVHIVVLGLVLDFVFGRQVLEFDKSDLAYLKVLHVSRLGARVPIEEVLFYILGPIAILLVYVWCDEYWMAAYNLVSLRIDRALGGTRLIGFSTRALALGLALEAAGILIARQHDGHRAVYYTFLVLVAFVPATILFGCVRDLVNWRAFGVTLLYLVLTSLIWEAALALPRGWWWYQDSAMIGIHVGALTHVPERTLPLEAVLVWICAPFSIVLAYETVKAWLYGRDPNKPVFVP